jgi:hypothetical protein
LKSFVSENESDKGCSRALRKVIDKLVEGHGDQVSFGWGQRIEAAQVRVDFEEFDVPSDAEVLQPHVVRGQFRIVGCVPGASLGLWG